MRIIYLCPEVTDPSGGIKRLYDHVAILRRHGFDAYIAQQRRGEKPHWFETDIEPIALEALNPFQPDDHIVIPDGIADVLPSFQGCRITLLILNPYYLLRAEKLMPVLELTGSLSVITNSPTVARFLGWLYGRVNIQTVRTGIDHSLFFPEQKRPPIKIAYTRRKDTVSDMVIHLAMCHLQREGRGADIEVVCIEDRPLEEYARILRQSHIWLTTALVHGFPRSTLEAMACGCLCVGYAGTCGKDLIKPAGIRAGNFLAVSDGDLLALAMQLAEAIQAVHTGSGMVETVVESGIRTAARSTLEREEQSVVQAWERLISE